MGTLETALNDILENGYKVKRQAFHGDIFVGKHCKIILNDLNPLFSILNHESLKKVKNKFQTLFTFLKDILLLILENRFLSDNEKKKLTTYAKSLVIGFLKILQEL